MGEAGGEVGREDQPSSARGDSFKATPEHRLVSYGPSGASLVSAILMILDGLVAGDPSCRNM